MKKSGSNQIRHRARGWVLIALALLAALAAKLWSIQVTQHEHFRELADNTRGHRLPIQAPRGNIYDRNGNPLAFNLKLYSIAVDPSIVIDPAATAAALAPLLRMRQEDLQRAISPQGDVRYVLLRQTVDQPIADAARQLDEPALIVNTQWNRAYPHQTLAAALLGLVGTDRVGLAGIEAARNQQLAGADGEMLVLLDGRLPQSRAEIPGRTVITRHMTPGSSLALTIDLAIQSVAEEELANAVEAAGAIGGTALVMDPNTGAVLAIAAQPSFDPNEFQRYDPVTWVSQAVSAPYEPGSTFKAVTACAAIEEDIMADGQTHVCTGSMSIGRRTISCALHQGTHAHGELDLDQMVIKSCNVGLASVALSLGADSMYRWARRFGFGERSGIELLGESPGQLTPPARWSQVQVANIGFGQGISVTPIQLLSAYCTIANGGRRVHPHVVQRVQEARPEQIISPATSDRMRAVLEMVVQEGTGTLAQIPGRRVAGKTGTAQKWTPEEGYRSGKYIASFVGFAPADNPRLAILVVIDEPTNGHYGGVVAAPAFRGICERALSHLRVPPEDRYIAVGAAPPGLHG